MRQDKIYAIIDIGERLRQLTSLLYKLAFQVYKKEKPMEDKAHKRSRALGLLVPLDDAEALISEADGSAALLYLYILREGSVPRAPEAARALKRTEREISSALARLRELGLVEPGETKILRQADERPEFTSREIAARSENDSEFRAVVLETQRIFGKALSGAELRILFALYDHLALPAEVLLLLVNHCVEEFRAENGGGRLPTLKRIEREGYTWSDAEVITLERADEYIRRKRERHEMISLVKPALGIRGRELSPTEKKYIEAWVAMGFGVRALEIAYDRTVVKTGSLQWKYMNSIVENWHYKGLHTPEEIEKSALPPERTPRNEPAKRENAPSAPRENELERMRKILDRVKNGKT